MPQKDFVRQSASALGEVFHKLAKQKESRIMEVHLQPDYVHMLLLILHKPLRAAHIVKPPTLPCWGY
jgi:REP element-mobilizing transposase RayT